MRKILLIITMLLCFAADVSAQVNKHYFVWVGRDMIMENRYREAIETLNTLLSSDPDAYEGYFWRGVAKYSLDDMLGAEHDFTVTLEKNPVYTMAYHFRALAHTRMGNYNAALKDFKEAIDLRPDYTASYFSRGVTYIMTGDYPKAVEDFNMYLRFNTRDADAYANRGVACLNLKDTTAAFNDFDRAIKTNREHPRGYAERGSLYMAQGKYDLAIDDFTTSAKCDPSNIAYYFNRAIAYHAKGKLRESLADLDRVIDMETSTSVAYFNRALLRTEIGDYNRALEDYNSVASLSPDNVLVYYNRAGLYRTVGDFRAALKDYDRAIELFPDFANAYYNRAAIKYLLKDTKGSERDRLTAERKVAEYRSKVKSGDISQLSDTSANFSRMLSFDTRMSDIIKREKVAVQDNVSLRPLYKFTLSTKTDSRNKEYDAVRLNEFIASLNGDGITFSAGNTDISPDDLLIRDSKIADALLRYHNKWQLHFERGITQALLKQYTNAVNSLSAAIELDPSNPFLYINRSTVSAEMTDFISSMDDRHMRISLESDRHNGSMESTTRTYNYDEAIADLNKAAKLYPELAYIYYNRGNLFALSGNFDAACEDYSKALELDPHFADAYFNRGLVKIYRNDIKGGLIDMSKAGELGIPKAYEVLKMYPQ